MKKWFIGSAAVAWNEWASYDTREEAIQAAKDLAYEWGGNEIQVFEGELLGTAFIPEPEAQFELAK